MRVWDVLSNCQRGAHVKDASARDEALGSSRHVHKRVRYSSAGILDWLQRARNHGAPKLARKRKVGMTSTENLEESSCTEYQDCQTSEELNLRRASRKLCAGDELHDPPGKHMI